MSVWDMDKPERLPGALLRACFPVVGIFGMLMVLLNLPVSPPRRAPIGPFAGCYTDRRSTIELGADGVLRTSQAKIGTFYIVEAVGGKHGPYVQTDNVIAVHTNNIIEFRRGANNYIWPIDRNGNLSIFVNDVGFWNLWKTSFGICGSVNKGPTNDVSSRPAQT